jgi:glycosyltransferase involved in cell wall biosynthesis
MHQEVVILDLPHPKNRDIHKAHKLGSTNFFIIGLDQILNLDMYFNQNEFRKSFNILIPFWELENIDEKFNPLISQFDEIWAPTTFIYNMFKNRKQKVRKIPFLTDYPKNELNKTISNNNKSDYFITILDLASGVDRKNVLGTIEAFLKYRDKYKAKQRLIIKVYSSQKNSEKIQKLIHLKMNNLRKNGIVFIQEFLSEKELNMLIKGSIAYVSLHKSEGLGLNVLQAMSLRKKVIVTNYGGVTDFCNDTNSYLVNYKLSLNLKQRDNIYKLKSKWATPNINSAVKQFRLASEDYNSMFYDKENNAILTLINLNKMSYTAFNKIYMAYSLRQKISSLIKLANI